MTDTDLREWALESERLRFGSTTLAGREVGKALLARSASVDMPLASNLSLARVTPRADWVTYTQHREIVEISFGISAEETHSMVRAIQDDQDRIGLTMFLVKEHDQPVGGIGFFPVPGTPVVRLQEVDIFPAWRGQGRGRALLDAVLTLAADQGAASVVVGADEDDWPLSWYRRAGFRDVARVALTR